MNASTSIQALPTQAPRTGVNLAAVLDSLDEGIAVLDAECNVIAANVTWMRWHAKALGEGVRPGANLDRLLRAARAEASRWLAIYHAHLRAADGAWLEFEWHAGRWVRARFETQDGGLLVSVLDDVSSQHAREEALRESAERFRSFAQTSGDWFWEVDEKLCYRVHTVNSHDVTGESTDLIGTSFIDGLRKRAVVAQDAEIIIRSMEAREPFRDCQVRLREDSRTGQVYSLSGMPFMRADGVFGGYRGTGRNITESHRLAARLAYQATHDDLTGLSNRRAMEARIARLMAERAQSDTKHALCFLDVDQIKVINDTCGHVAGDALLNRLARMLSEGLQGADTVARLSGDEFAVLLRNCDARKAHEVAEKMCRGIAESPFAWEGKQFRVTVSIGVAPLSHDMQEAGDLLRAADSACYAAKERGRNRVKLYALDDSTLNLRQGEMHWVARIHSALAESRLELRLQPITPTCAQGDDYQHFEALLRMNGRDGRTFSPSAFLPAAERYNLASQIDAWVLDEALGWLQRSPGFLERLNLVSVNLSGQSLGEPAFLDLVYERMRRHPTAAAKICFEITETAAISKLDRVQEFMQRLRTFGCSFALDDFGAGLSSFAYLRTLDVDYLKIDGMFIKDVHEDPIHEAMVRSINEVGHVMGKKTIAEFVESDAVRQKLADIGVDYVQGYAIGEPLPFGDVV